MFTRVSLNDERGYIMKKVNVHDAVFTLWNHGLNGYKEEVRDSVTRGQAIGLALSSHLTPREVIELAGEALEDMNCHVEAKIIRDMRTSVKNQYPERVI